MKPQIGRIPAIVLLLLLSTWSSIALQRGGGGFGQNNATAAGATQPNLAQASLPAGNGSIEGVVRRAGDKAPIAGAAITVSTPATVAGSRSPQVEAVTDSAGRFSFRNIAPALYSIRIRSDGFFGSNANGTTAPAETIVLTLTAAQPNATPEILLVPAAAISGRVLDAEGRPVANVQVTPVRRRYVAGEAIFAAAGRAQTNDRGEYRISDLEPGEYFVRAVNLVQSATGPQPQVVTYFPSSPDVFSATTVVANGGSEVVVDMRLIAGALRRVSGKIVSPGGVTGTLRFLLLPQGRKSMFDNLEAAARQTAGGADGAFEIQTMRPGLYDLFVIGESSLSGRAAVDLRDRDVTGLTVTLTPGHELSVSFDGNTGPAQGLVLVSVDAALPSALRATTSGGFGGGGFGARGQSSETVFANVPQGRYVLADPVKTQRRGASDYIADIRQNGQSLLEDGIITIGAEKPAPVQIVIVQSGGVISGRIEGSAAEGKGVSIVAVPEGSRRQNLLLYSLMALLPNRGLSTFRMTGLTPGRYKLYAFENLQPGAEQNAEFMAPYEPRGIVVDVPRGALTSDVVLPLIRRNQQ
jgi:Carboxypeptidase regulatory-like domain